MTLLGFGLGQRPDAHPNTILGMQHSLEFCIEQFLDAAHYSVPVWIWDVTKDRDARAVILDGP